MAARYELWCSRCEHAVEYPAWCLVEVGANGDEHLLAPGDDSFSRKAVRVFPTVCLRCGQLGAHRADSRRQWSCAECGSLAIRQLGFDPRGAAVLVGLVLAVLLVGVPATSSIVWALPGIATLGLLAVSVWVLERRGEASLRRVPCSVCGERQLHERRVHGRAAQPSRDSLGSGRHTGTDELRDP